ncbi:MAG: ABC transporter permease [Treponema sp.]|jgi:spermidine/putrescine transport system permease protein|nr:ABC transporter permease [Treponema sp.]
MNFRALIGNVFNPSKTARRLQSEESRHAKRAYFHKYSHRPRLSFSATVFTIAIIFLFLPLVVLVVNSFNGSSGISWGGFSLRWYERLLQEKELWRAFRNSIFIALTSAVSAVIIGTLGAVGINWYRFKLRGYIQTISFLPMILPEIILGVSLSIFFAWLEIPLGLFTIYVAHTTFNIPFVFLMVMARLDEFDFSIIEAASDLGASERQTLYKVILPICMPGIISGFLTAITLSLEDFVITFFVAGPGSSTLPIFIYSAITRKSGITPLISALSVVMIFGTVILCITLRRFLKYIAAK